MNPLLDAQVVLWAPYEPELLSKRVAYALADQSNDLFVSHGILWEIVNNAATHRLTLAGSSPYDL